MVEREHQSVHKLHACIHYSVPSDFVASIFGHDTHYDDAAEARMVEIIMQPQNRFAFVLACKYVAGV